MRTKVVAALKQIPTLITIAFVIATAIVAKTDPTSEAKALFLIAGMVAALSLNAVISAINEAGERKKSDEIAEHLKRVEDRVTALSDGYGTLTPPPRDDDEYSRLWGGFKGKYYAYNPAFELERNTGLGHHKKLVERVFLPRYKDGNTLAYYLFFTGDEHGRKNRDDFVQLMSCSKQCDKIRKYIQAKELPGRPAVGNAEMYFGMQHGVHTVVVELTEPWNSRGTPDHYLVITQKNYHDRLLKQFEDDWRAAIPVAAFEAIEKNGKTIASTEVVPHALQDKSTDHTTRGPAGQSQGADPLRDEPSTTTLID
jgi:hypothetical protein